MQVSTSEIRHTSYLMVPGFRHQVQSHLPLKLWQSLPLLRTFTFWPHTLVQTHTSSLSLSSATVVTPFSNLDPHSTNLEKPAQDSQQQQLVQETHLPFTLL